MLSKEEHAERLSLYYQGLTDKEIANRLNYLRETITAWRIRK